MGLYQEGNYVYEGISIFNYVYSLLILYLISSSLLYLDLYGKLLYCAHTVLYIQLLYLLYYTIYNFIPKKILVQCLIGIRLYHIWYTINLYLTYKALLQSRNSFIHFCYTRVPAIHISSSYEIYITFLKNCLLVKINLFKIIYRFSSVLYMLFKMNKTYSILKEKKVFMLSTALNSLFYISSM